MESLCLSRLGIMGNEKWTESDSILIFKHVLSSVFTFFQAAVWRFLRGLSRSTLWIRSRSSLVGMEVKDKLPSCRQRLRLEGARDTGYKCWRRKVTEGEFCTGASGSHQWKCTSKDNEWLSAYVCADPCVCLGLFKFIINDMPCRAALKEPLNWHSKNHWAEFCITG